MLPRVLGVALVGALVALAAAPARAVTLGPTTLAAPAGISGGCAAPPCTRLNFNVPFGLQRTAPANGVLTRWRVAAFGALTLRVVRRNGATAEYSGVRTGPTVTGPTTSAITTSESHVPIDSGDEIAIDVPTGSAFGGATAPFGAPGWSWETFSPGLSNGGAPVAGSVENDSAIALNADFELDADNDTFGDETQDRCLGRAGTDRGCPPGELDATGAQVVQTTILGLAELDPASVKLSKGRSRLTMRVSCTARTRWCVGRVSAKTADKFSTSSGSKKSALSLGSSAFGIPGAGRAKLTLHVPKQTRKKIAKLKTVRLKLDLRERASLTRPVQPGG